MKKIKFIHCADLHLGSVINIKNISLEHFHRKINFSLNSVFKKIINLAIEEKVDFILLSGDTFNTEDLDVKTDRLFLEQCLKLKEQDINVYIIAGNHDPLEEKQYLFNLPPNVYIFPPNEVSSICYERKSEKVVNIIGMSYASKSVNENYITQYNSLLEDNMINIGMLHTSLKSTDSYSPCTLEQLKRSNIDYWALGHIHKNNILNIKKPTIVYAGIPQGRDFGEQQCGGVYLVQYEGRKIENITYKYICDLKYKEVSLIIKEQDVININSLDCLRDYIIDELIQQLNLREEEGSIIIRININSEIKISMLGDMKQKDRMEFVDYINRHMWNKKINLILSHLNYNYNLKKDEISIEEYILNDILKEVENLYKDEDLGDFIGDIWTSNEEILKRDKVFFLDKQNKEEIIKETFKNIITRLS